MFFEPCAVPTMLLILVHAMSRRFQLACYVPDQVGNAFVERARSRNLTVASALRQLVIADLYRGADPAELRQNILFQTFALDGLLASHNDPDLRARVLRVWRERLAEEDRGHEA